MCLCAIGFQTDDSPGVFAVANRDELRTRPTLSPALHRENAGHTWFGPSDALAGGTWFGVSCHGWVATVTNRRTEHSPRQPRSRGLLCRELLASRSVEQAEEQLERELSQHEYAGFNIALLSPARAIIVEAADQRRITVLTPGVHFLANSPLGDPDDLRVEWARFRFEELDVFEVTAEQRLERLRNWSAMYDPRDREHSVCRRDGQWGTVSSSLLILNEATDACHYEYSPGVPGDTDFVDYSEPLRDMLRNEDTFHP